MKKDNRIAQINLLSNGYIVVQDKDDKPIKGLCCVWTKKKEEHLRKVTPEGIEFGSWEILEYAKKNMDRFRKPK